MNITKRIQKSFMEYKMNLINNPDIDLSSFKTWQIQVTKYCIKRGIKQNLIENNFTEKQNLKFLKPYESYPINFILRLLKSRKIFDITNESIYSIKKI